MFNKIYSVKITRPNQAEDEHESGDVAKEEVEPEVDIEEEPSTDLVDEEDEEEVKVVVSVKKSKKKTKKKKPEQPAVKTVESVDYSELHQSLYTGKNFKKSKLKLNL